MEPLRPLGARRQTRFQSLATEIGWIPETVLICQVWTASSERRSFYDADAACLRVEAQSAISSESVRDYASSCASRGIPATAMQLLEDCQRKGATVLVEDIAQVDSSQHPGDKLAGPDIPACSAIFLPVFDPADSSSWKAGSLMPVALLEVLVCKTAQLVYNHSDLINDVCRIMDTYQLCVSKDASAYKQWAHSVSPFSSGRASSPTSPVQPQQRNSLSRTSSIRRFSSDESEQMLSDESVFGRLHGVFRSPMESSRWWSSQPDPLF